MTNRNIIGICASLVVAASFLLACSSTTEEGILLSSEFIKLTGSSVELTKDAVSQTVVVEANCDWTPKVENGWPKLVVSQSSQSSVSVSTDENLSREIRTATLVIESKGGIRYTLPIHQAVGDVNISTNVKADEAVHFGDDGGDRTFEIISNTTWDISISYPAGDSEWLKADTREGSNSQTVKLSAEKAITDVERNAIITIKSTEQGESANTSIAVKQDGIEKIELEITPDRLEFGCVAGEDKSQELAVSKSNAQWRLTPVAISPADDTSWFKVSSDNGIGTGNITVTCENNVSLNRRYATLICTSGNKNGGENRQVMIEQAAGEIPSITNFEAVSTETILKSISFLIGFTSDFAVTEYGVCYSTTNSLPTISDEHATISGGTTTANNQNVNIDNLQPRSNYFARGYAKNAVGIAYSNNVITFITLGESPTQDDNPPLF